ncbi:MAG: hypothetical protein HY695_00635 [Deltaproteobacteria bacterium]|nr:hypothetical protein [Deltaproteobacteria bacterium]
MDFSAKRGRQARAGVVNQHDKYIGRIDWQVTRYNKGPVAIFFWEDKLSNNKEELGGVKIMASKKEKVTPKISGGESLPFPPTPSGSIAGRTMQESVYSPKSAPAIGNRQDRTLDAICLRSHMIFSFAF